MGLYFNKSFDVVVNLQMNLRNCGVSGGVGFGGVYGAWRYFGGWAPPPPRESEKPGGGLDPPPPGISMGISLFLFGPPPPEAKRARPLLGLLFDSTQKKSGAFDVIQIQILLGFY